jgi:hypothetical protein
MAITGADCFVNASSGTWQANESGTPQAVRYSMAATRQGHTLAAPILVAGLGLAAALGTAAAPGTAAAQEAALATQIVDAMNKVYGVHPGFRANHAKGVVAEGFFKAAPEAARLSKAVLFNGTSIPVTVRFSDSTGVPICPMARRWRIRTEWPSNFISPAATKPT